jgi:hypothetical protein
MPGENAWRKHVADRRVEFVFDSGGKPRRVLSVIERGNGNVIINNLPKGAPGSTRQKRAPSMRGHGALPEEVAFKQVRYSVHPSEESSIVNVIKRTEELEDGTLTTSHFHTLGIKQTDTYCPIFVQRYDQLKDPIYDFDKPNSEIEKLGDCEPIFGLILGVFAGPPRPFMFDSPGDFQFRQFRFAGFSVLLIWSFFAAPPSGIAEVYPYTTLNTGPQSTINDAHCIGQFNQYRQQVRAELASIWSRNPRDRTSKAVAELAFNFREGRAGTQEFAAYMQLLAQRGIVRMVNGQPCLFVDAS